MLADGDIFPWRSICTRPTATALMRQDFEHCSCGSAVEDRTGQAYNEEAFRHFLSIERARVQRGNRSFLLLLVRLKKDAERGCGIGPAVAARLFAGLALCVREVDFVGWYRNEQVAGAVLTQGPEAPTPETPERIARRVRAVLSQSLPSGVARRLHVRVLQLRRGGTC